MKSLIILFSVFVISNYYCHCCCSHLKEDYIEEYRVINEEKNNYTRHKTSFNDISDELLIYIGGFLTDPVKSFGVSSHYTLSKLLEYYSLKYYVIQRFCIPEIISVPDVYKNDKEFLDILNLDWCREDRFFLFCSLMEDISSGKKSFNILFRPLILFLSRTFLELPLVRQNDFISHWMPRYHGYFDFNNYLAEICAKYGHYDLVFEFLKANQRELIIRLSRVVNKEHLMNFFKSNPDLVEKYLNALINVELLRFKGLEIKFYNIKNTFDWISDCIANDAPEAFYIELLNFRPGILKGSTVELIRNLRVRSESDHQKIYIRLKNILNDEEQVVSKHDFEFSNLLNDIRFSTEDDHNLNLSDYDRDEIYYMAETALRGNKKETFFNVYNWSKSKKYSIMDSLIRVARLEDYINVNSRVNFKIIFDIIALDILTDMNFQNYLMFITNFYAINSFKMEGLGICIEFVALEDLLILDFPPVIHIRTQEKSDSNWFFENIFALMKVLNEEMVISFISEYERSSRFKTRHSISFELLELVSISPILLDKFISLKMKFYFNSNVQSFERYFYLPNFEGTSKIIKPTDFDSKILTELKSEDHLDKMERIQDELVKDLFLDFEIDQITGKMTEITYFEWRIVFAYWIKRSDQNKWIKDIKSPEIVRLLLLEFPEEAGKFLLFQR